MAEQTARTVVISGILLLSVMTGIFVLISMSIPPGTDTGNYNSTLTKLANIETQTNQIQSDIQSPPKKIIGNAVIDGLIQGTIGAASQMWSTVSALKSFFDELGEGALGPIDIPGWVIMLITSIIGLTLAYALMSAWFKWRI